MKATPFSFKVLFCFENKEQLILEIKHLTNQPILKSERYQWFRINKKQPSLKKLTFCSMASHPEQEQRIFKEGTLRFDLEAGTFEQCPLMRIDPLTLEEKWLQLIQDSEH